MMNAIYTIGYSGFTIEAFLETLKQRHVNVLIDVRSFPYSEFFQQYNKDILSGILIKNSIYYRNYAKEFGARQKNPNYHSPDGYLDFERFAQSAPFQEGVKKIIDSINQDYTIAFMCSEKEPINCHRAILVARAFYNLGYPIMHLLPDSGIETQADLEKELLNQYFPNRNQLSLFQSFDDNSDNLINEAYRLQNAKIGYKMTESESA